MLQDTMRAQYELGHRSFMEGMLTTMWTQVQQQDRMQPETHSGTYQ